MAVFDVNWLRAVYDLLGEGDDVVAHKLLWESGGEPPGCVVLRHLGWISSFNVELPRDFCMSALSQVYRSRRVMLDPRAVKAMLDAVDDDMTSTACWNAAQRFV